jgi:hypothetical protein
VVGEFSAVAVPDAHPCLILDSRVADALRRRCGWRSLHPEGNWPAITYQRYCDLLARWATEESARRQHTVGPDQIEGWLFSEGLRQGSWSVRGQWPCRHQHSQGRSALWRAGRRVPARGEGE